METTYLKVAFIAKKERKKERNAWWLYRDSIQFVFMYLLDVDIIINYIIVVIIIIYLFI